MEGVEVPDSTGGGAKRVGESSSSGSGSSRHGQVCSSWQEKVLAAATAEGCVLPDKFAFCAQAWRELAHLNALWH
eukprot:scaffold97624_cov21-Tisochrysis_lutea.AAC.1